MVSTSSQQRSLNAITNLWSNSLHLFNENPLTGIGADNFQLKYNSLNINEENPFSGRIANSFLQILIEKGILGVLAYSFLTIVFFIVSFGRKIKDIPLKTSRLLFAACFIALFVREMSFSSLFTNDALLTLVFIIILNNTHNTKETNEIPNFFIP